MFACEYFYSSLSSMLTFRKKNVCFSPGHAQKDRPLGYFVHAQLNLAFNSNSS